MFKEYFCFPLVNCIWKNCLVFSLYIVQGDVKQFGNEKIGTSDGSGRFVPSERVLTLRKKLIKFMEDHIYPMEEKFYELAQSDSRWTVHPEEERLKELAKKEGLWNLWIPVYISNLLTGLTYVAFQVIFLSSSKEVGR